MNYQRQSVIPHKNCPLPGLAVGPDRGDNFYEPMAAWRRRLRTTVRINGLSEFAVDDCYLLLKVGDVIFQALHAALHFAEHRVGVL